MTKVYLHIGLPKTATTTIQKWLSTNTSTLRKAGIFAFGDVCFGHRLAIAAVDDKTQQNRKDIAGIVRRAPLNEVTNQLANVARDESIQTAIISSEYFSLADPKTVKELLSEAGLEDVSIILVLRRQDRYIESGYSQDVAGADGTTTIETPVYDPLCDWYALTRAWAEIFSPDALLLHTYEKASADGRIIERVIGSLNPKVAEVVAGNPAAQEWANASLPAELIEFKRLANRGGAPDILSFLEKAASKGIGREPFRMNSKLAKSFLDLYRDSNKKLSKEFFGRNGDLFEETDLKADNEGVDYTDKLPPEILAVLLAFHVQEIQRMQAESAGLQRWLLETTQSVNSLCGWVQADLIALKEEMNNRLAQLPERVRHEAFIGVQPLYHEVQSQADRVTSLKNMVERLEDITSPRRLMQIGWNRLTSRMRRT